MDRVVDILLATFNGERLISEQIDSILNQTYTNWNLIIRDDGSTDNTIMIIKDYINKHPHKIKLIEDEKRNLGSSKNFSELLNYSKSEYIMFCDQDDVWLPDKIRLSLEKIVELENAFGREKPLLVFNDLFVVDDSLKIISDSFWRLKKRKPQNTSLNRLIVQNVITGCAMIINKMLLELSMPIAKSAMMHDWWMGLVASSYGEIGYIRAPLIYYRQHSSNVIGANRKSVKQFLKKIATGRFDKRIFREHIQRVFDQADSFLAAYKDSLPLDKHKIVQNFVSLRHSGFWTRKYKILRYDFYCSSAIDNFELLIRL